MLITIATEERILFATLIIVPPHTLYGLFYFNSTITDTPVYQPPFGNFILLVICDICNIHFALPTNIFQAILSMLHLLFLQDSSLPLRRFDHDEVIVADN